MNALTATSTFSPSSFQLKLKLNGRKSPLAFFHTRSPEISRRRFKYISLVVRSGAVNGNGVEQGRAGNSTWINSNNSPDSFSGWSNADGEGDSIDSKRKQSLAGILGAVAAGLLLVTGLTFAALSISNRNTSKVKQQMESLTTQQEESLSSENHEDRGKEKAREEDNVEVPESGSEDSNTGINKDPPLDNENNEANENRIRGEDTIVRQPDEDSDGSIQEVVQSESAVSENFVSPIASEKPPTSESEDDSVSKLNIQNQNGSIASENLDDSETKDAPNSKLLDSSVSFVDNNFEEDDHLDGVFGFPLDSSYAETSITNVPAKSQADAVTESSNNDEDYMESGSFISAEELPTVDVNPSKNFGVSAANGDDKSLEVQNLTGTGDSLMPEVYYRPSIEQKENKYKNINVNRSYFDPSNSANLFTSAGIPAPSVVSAALQAPPGKILVPAVVDQLQSQALSALQVLKVIEDDVQPGDLCSRREYARWLVVASSVLSRNTTSKVYPAMYIDNFSELAFDDITPEDPDFSSIQGLAEAGLIASKLSRSDMQPSLDKDPSPLFFSPESPLSRQDLVSWKMALEKRQLPVVDKKKLQQLSGFIDIDKIDPDAWPALAADLLAGEQGITTLAFGYTRLFQPEKPVTKAQAAIALSTGDASAMVGEELARIEAESMAENVVAEHSALVAQVEKDINASFEKELSMEREKINAIEALAEEARKEVERLKVEREEENLSLMKERAAADSEMEILSRLRREVEEQLQTLMTDKVEISYEKERMSKLRKDAETENQEITRLQYELEVERKALSMARAWAEDEAKRAREQAKALEVARDRWESQGIKVVVDKDLQEEADVGITWLATEKQFSVEETVERSETLIDKLKAMANEVKGKCKITIDRIIEKIHYLISNLKEKGGEFKDAAKSKLDSSLQGAQQRSVELTVAAKDGVKRVAGDWKVGVERLTQKFKT